MLNEFNSTLEIDQSFEDEMDDLHICTSSATPIREDAFLINDKQKIEIIADHFREIMLTLGLDLDNDSLKGTPKRVAKMYVEEIFSGLNPKNKPSITLFQNSYRYNEMIIEKNITLYSYCEHHFVPITGKIHVAYISNGNIIGLSKINRLVQYYASRPQVQERLINQIANSLKEVLETENVAVVIDAFHQCVASRGIRDTNSSTITVHYSGRFTQEEIKNDFLALIKNIY